MTSKQRDLFQQLADQFEIAFLERGTEIQPRNIGALEALAFAYTRTGEYQRGLAIDRRLAEAWPHNPMILYNLACSLSLVGDLDACVDTLQEAINLGYDDWRHMDADEDLENLRADPRYAGLRKRICPPSHDADEML